MKNIKIFALTVAASFLTMTGCSDLDTSNLNNPDTRQVLASGDDLTSVLSGGYLSWFQGIHQSHPANTLEVASDGKGCSWGNFGMRRMSEEPRDAYNNSTGETQDYSQVVTDPWFGALAGQATGNDILRSLDEGLSLGDEDLDQMLRASAYFLRGLSRGYLGLLFDQAYLTEPDTDLTQQLEFTPYAGVIAEAVSDMEQVITLSADTEFTMDGSFLNGLALTNTQLVEAANSYAARFLAQAPRTQAETDAVDWARVLAFAEDGIDGWNLAPIADGNFWFGYWRYAHTGQTGNPDGSWLRIDMRVINALDPNQPTRYPVDGSAPPNGGLMNSDDARVLTDFIYTPNNNFRPERGLWHFSHYKWHRNITDPSYIGDGINSGPMPIFVETDTDLLEAEALTRLGRLADAAAIINAGTRITRGQLAPVAADRDALIEAVLYERYVEIASTGPGGTFFDRRRIGEREPFTAFSALGGLQEGTPAHLPVPAVELEVFALDTYNFGGDDDPTGLVRN